jgi:exopolysaccharide/PEP-CTERM locus tyrosine autokinase
LEKAERERAEELLKKAAPLTPPGGLPGPRLEPSVQMVALDKLEVDPSLVSLFQPQSLISEQFRKLRTHLLRLNMARPVKTIMVTSAMEGEGKSFVAANLAIGVAYDLHLYSLLVDCDLRNPSVGSLFGRRGGRGMTDFLAGQGDISDYLVKTEMDKLSIIPAGSIPENPTEILGSRRMADLVEEMKGRYQDRFIIFDSTPLLATAEPTVLAKLVDGIIVVVRAGMTPRDIVQQAISVLDKDKILGVVLNDVSFKSKSLFKRYFGSDGYYSRYGYGYGRTPAEERKGWRKLIKKDRG